LDNTSEAKLQIKKLLTKILDCFPRRKGNGWTILKSHELLDLALDTQQYGLQANFDAGWGERELKTAANLQGCLRNVTTMTFSDR
jgi:hypothetical protein